MYKTKSKPLRRIALVLLCSIMVCVALSSTAFAPSQIEMGGVSQMFVQTTNISPPLQTISTTGFDRIASVDIKETEPELDSNPYADLVLTEDEKIALACMAYSEAGNQEFEGQVAVVLVALNRLLHFAFPDNITDILFSPYQFIVGEYYDEKQMDAVNAALSGDPILDLNTDVVFFSTGKLTCGSYYKTIGDHVFRTYS